MSARNLLFTVLGCLLALGVSTTTSAQDSNNANELSEELAALQIMGRTVGPMLTQANTRNGQMTAYIGEKKLSSDWDSYKKTASEPAQLSFADGYKIALKRVKTEQPVSQSGASASDLQKSINATKSVEGWLNISEGQWRNPKRQSPKEDKDIAKDLL